MFLAIGIVYLGLVWLMSLVPRPPRVASPSLEVTDATPGSVQSPSYVQRPAHHRCCSALVSIVVSVLLAQCSVLCSPCRAGRCASWFGSTRDLAGLPIIITLFFIFFVLRIHRAERSIPSSLAAIGLSLWGSANVAESSGVRMQSVPHGQTEAAAALWFPMGRPDEAVIL